MAGCSSSSPWSHLATVPDVEKCPGAAVAKEVEHAVKMCSGICHKCKCGECCRTSLGPTNTFPLAATDLQSGPPAPAFPNGPSHCHSLPSPPPLDHGDGPIRRAALAFEAGECLPAVARAAERRLLGGEAPRWAELRGCGRQRVGGSSFHDMTFGSHFGIVKASSYFMEL